MRMHHWLGLAVSAALIAFALAGAAFARQSVQPDRFTSAKALRAAVDHYRALTFTYERAAHLPRTKGSTLYRRSSDRAYLDWTIAIWRKRAYGARKTVLTQLHRSREVALPAPPGLHASLSRRIEFSRRLALSLRSIYPGTPTRSVASAGAPTGTATLRLWETRSAQAALRVTEKTRAVPGFLQSAFACIHHYEGSWHSNTGNGYYGGLQMDLAFQHRYGGDYLRRYGTADRWPAWAQIQAATRAYSSGRGFYPWPNTARFCGLI